MSGKFKIKKFKIKIEKIYTIILIKARLKLYGNFGNAGNVVQEKEEENKIWIYELQNKKRKKRIKEKDCDHWEPYDCS